MMKSFLRLHRRSIIGSRLRPKKNRVRFQCCFKNALLSRGVSTAISSSYARCLASVFRMQMVIIIINFLIYYLIAILYYGPQINQLLCIYSFLFRICGVASKRAQPSSPAFFQHDSEVSHHSPLGSNLRTS